MNRFYYIVVLLVNSALAFSQGQIPLKYAIVSKSYGDSIVLRYAPEQSTSLPSLQNDGVWIERMISSGKYPYTFGKWERLNATPIKPWSLEKFTTQNTKNDKNPLVVAQLLYGDNTNPSLKTGGLNGMKDAASVFNSLFYMALLSCDYSSTAASSMGLRFTDHHKMKEDEKIYYKVFSATKDPLFKVDTAFSVSIFGEWQNNEGPAFLNAQAGEKSITLTWDHNKALHHWSGYFIERSSDNGKSFKRLNQKPYYVMSPGESTDKISYADSVSNYVPYIYAVKAIDIFGDITEYGMPIKSFGIDKTPPGDLILEEKSETIGVSLKWKFINGSPSSDLKHFLILKGNQVNTAIDTVAIVAKSTFVYHDKNHGSGRSRYYEVHAVDTSGNHSASNPIRYFVPDATPPAIPTGLKGTIDQKGVVTLQWDRDTLDDLVGYRVYLANQLDHDFVCLQQGYLGATTFVDTISLETLTDSIYYAVCAVDLSYNHSTRSKPILIKKPDILRPYPPSIYDYELSNNAATFRWHHSPSSDVTDYLIKRIDLSSKEKGENREVVKKISKSNNNFKDEGLIHGHQYEYTIIAIDEVGLKSDESFPLTIKAYGKVEQDDLNLILIKDIEKIGISWTQGKKTPLYYIIYRDTGSGFVKYENADSKSTRFIDSKTVNYKKVRYGLQAVYDNQAKSEIYNSDWKTISK